MASREFDELVKRLSQQVVDAPDVFEPSQRNEEWTKINFILPLLEGLGWDRFTDVAYEVSPQDVEGALDFVLRCQPPIGIEAKALDVKPPEDRSHPQIKKGLAQSEERSASYFVWTNGDCWQFFSLHLPAAPMYSVALSDAHDHPEQRTHIVDQLHLIEKASFSANPAVFDEAIRENWKAAALPAAFDALLHERTHDLVELVRRDLPNELDIQDEEILAFFKALELPSPPTEVTKKRTRRDQKPLSFPEDWQQLLDSFEPRYEKARKRFRKGYYLKLAQYLIRDQCRPWSKTTTWRHVGMSSDPNERKRLGPVIALFREWHFIEDAEGIGMYQRVEDSVPFLRKLFGEPPKP